MGTIIPPLVRSVCRPFPRRAAQAAAGKRFVRLDTCLLLRLLVPSLLLVAGVPAAAQEQFRRGDTNADGRVDIGDAAHFSCFWYRGEASIECRETADVNVDGILSQTDGIFFLQWLFVGGVRPPDPGPYSCGPHPFETDVGCLRYPACGEPEPRAVDPRFMFRFGAPVKVGVSASNNPLFEVAVQLCAAEPVTGWSMSISAQDCSITDTTIEGTDTEQYENEGGFFHNFRLTPEGVLGGTLLAAWGDGAVPETGMNEDCEAAMLLRLTVEAHPGAERCALEFVDGLAFDDGDPPLDNLVTTADCQDVVPHRPQLELAAWDIVSEPSFFRGDSNDDGDIDIADTIFTLSHLFGEGPFPSCGDAADANDDGDVDIADAIAILSHLFGSSGDLPEPFGECGIDPTIDDLTCDGYESCRDR